jgi:membrane protein DedA with SNARE-associated domain
MWVLSHFTYVALIAVLIIAGTGVPIPEDIPLILSGYLCSETHSPILEIPKYVDLNGDGVKELVPRRIPNVYFMMLAGMAGVLAGDSIVYSIGKKGIEADNFVARHLRKVMTPKRREKLERHFEKHGNLTIFVGRFLPGLRGPIFAIAGMSKLTYARFVLIDGLAAVLSVPLFVWVGYYFAGSIEQLFKAVERVKHIVFPVALVLAAGAVGIWWVRRRRAAAALAAGAAAGTAVEKG